MPFTGNLLFSCGLGLEWIHLAVYILYIGIFGLIAVQDVRFRIIPNKLLTIVLVIRGLQILICSLLTLAYLQYAAEAVILFAAVAFVLFFTHILCRKKGFRMGAGDYKYILALSLALNVDAFIAAMLISLALLLFCYLLSFVSQKSVKPIPGALFLSAGAVFSCIMAVFELCFWLRKI